MGTPQGRAHFHKNVHGHAFRASGQPLASTRGKSFFPSKNGLKFPDSFQGKRGSREQDDKKPLAELGMDELIERARKEREALLPIYNVRDEILHQVANSPAVIITAETGAGKSTQVPQMLLDAGYSVVLTQPRRFAAHSVANRIAEERGGELGGEIGFKHAFEKSVGPDTKLVVTTDGYTLRSQLNAQRHVPDVLIIDEFHERNQSMDTLIALHRLVQEQAVLPDGSKRKVPRLVIMSATLDAEAISKKLGNAPIVHATGRSYPIETKAAGESMVADVCDLVAEEKNVLVFLPGKTEIRMFHDRLVAEGLNAEILPLHSQLPHEEQQKSMKVYERPKVVLATNIAETSITIADIDAVVDSGLERDMILLDGVETLSIHPISQFNLEQRRGRCGRCGPGTYIYHGKEAISRLPKVPTPEVQRVPLGDLILTLTAAERAIERLPYLDAPSEEHVELGRKKLRLLGLLSPQDRITKIGARVAELPVTVSDGAMIVHAEGLAEERRELAPVLELAIDLAAIHAVEGVLLPEKRRTWMRYTDEVRSDPLAHLQVLHAAEARDFSRLDKMGLDPLSVQRAIEYRALLTERLALGERPEELSEIVKRLVGSESNDKVGSYAQKIRKGLLESLLKGQMDSAFVAVERDEKSVLYKGLQEGGSRKLGKGSVLENAQYIVGKPFDLLVLKTNGSTVPVPLVLMATEIDTELLKKFSTPELKREILEQLKKWTKHLKLKESGDARPIRPQQGRMRRRK